MNQTSTAAHANRNRVALVITVNACMFLFGIVLFLMGALLPTLRVSYSHAGNLGSVPLIGILIATLIVGPILDMRGAKHILILAIVLLAASLAVLPSLHSYWQLYLCCLVYGFGGGILNTAANVLVSDLNTQSRTSALNLLGFFFSGGAVVAPLLMSVAAGSLSAPVVLRLLAGLTAIVLIPVIAFEFPPPLQAGVHLRQFFLVLKHPAVWLFGILLMFESCSENCMFVWSGKIVAEALHTTSAQANLALVGLGAALGVGRLLAVLWLRWLGNRGTIWLSAALVLAGILICITVHQLAGMVAAITVIGLGISAIFPTLLGIAGDRFPGETGTVFGAIIAIALVGGAAGPALGSYAISHGPLHVLWIPATSAMAISALVVLAGRNNRARPELAKV